MQLEKTKTCADTMPETNRCGIQMAENTSVYPQDLAKGKESGLLRKIEHVFRLTSAVHAEGDLGGTLNPNHAERL